MCPRSPPLATAAAQVLPGLLTEPPDDDNDAVSQISLTLLISPQLTTDCNALEFH